MHTVSVRNDEHVDMLVGLGFTIVKDTRGRCPSGDTGSAVLSHAGIEWIGCQNRCNWTGDYYVHDYYRLPDGRILRNESGTPRWAPNIRFVDEVPMDAELNRM